MFSGSLDRKSTRLNSSHGYISYAVFCFKKKKRPNKSAGRTHIQQPAQECSLCCARAELPACAPAVAVGTPADLRPLAFFFFFFNDTATTEIYTLSLHDALPICHGQPLVDIFDCIPYSNQSTY